VPSYEEIATLGRRHRVDGARDAGGERGDPLGFGRRRLAGFLREGVTTIEIKSGTA